MPHMSYDEKLNSIETQSAVVELKQCFQKTLSEKLKLEKIIAPLFVDPTTGFNDDLNGVERSVSFDTKCGKSCAVVQSLAKWKRYALSNMKKTDGTGIITDMIAIRRDEDLSPIHSYLVDQWDWEMVIPLSGRTVDTFKEVVKTIYSSIREVEKFVSEKWTKFSVVTPKDIFFISSQELEDKYPDLTPNERENACAKEHGAICIMQIGKVLKSGKPHDLRAPDYDDWDLNGDILLYFEPLDIALEISSMGIRVSEESMMRQLRLANVEHRTKLMFHQMVLNKELPYSIGGGIGQSRLMMFLLKKRHIGEIQVSVWDEKTIQKCAEDGIQLLK